MLKPKIKNNISEGDTVVLKLPPSVIEFLEEGNVLYGFYFDSNVLERIGDSDLFRVVDDFYELPIAFREEYKDFLKRRLDELGCET